jgi:hypothetical protein
MPWNLALRNQRGRFQESIWKQIIWIDRERDIYIFKMDWFGFLPGDLQLRVALDTWAMLT